MIRWQLTNVKNSHCTSYSACSTSITLSIYAEKNISFFFGSEILLWVEHIKKCREIFITSNLQNWYGLCSQYGCDLFLPMALLPLPRTYITSIINSLMIYGIFILFYSLSCPTAYYKNFTATFAFFATP